MNIRYFKYNDRNFVISTSHDNKGHIFIKDHRDRFMMWVGSKGLIPGTGMKDHYDKIKYLIVGIDEDCFS
jgi:hypothetical protein